MQNAVGLCELTLRWSLVTATGCQPEWWGAWSPAINNGAILYIYIAVSVFHNTFAKVQQNIVLLTAQHCAVDIIFSLFADHISSQTMPVYKAHVQQFQGFQALKETSALLVPDHHDTLVTIAHAKGDQMFFAVHVAPNRVHQNAKHHAPCNNSDLLT